MGSMALYLILGRGQFFRDTSSTHHPGTSFHLVATFQSFHGLDPGPDWKSAHRDTYACEPRFYDNSISANDPYWKGPVKLAASLGGCFVDHCTGDRTFQWRNANSKTGR